MQRLLSAGTVVRLRAAIAVKILGRESPVVQVAPQKSKTRTDNFGMHVLIASDNLR